MYVNMTSKEAVSGRRLSVSTWSLHRTLGNPRSYGVEQDIPVESHGRGAITLLELPQRLADFGIHTLEICHFHLPTLDVGYLRELRGALEQAEIELFSFLVDDGDITHPDPVELERNIRWINQWFDVASQLGARCIRVVGGKAAPSAESLEQSVRELEKMVERAQAQGMRLMTENWLNLLSTPQAVQRVCGRLDGKVGLCFDFGNWRGEGKYADLEQIVTYAESCHTKAHFAAPFELDRADYERCLEITRRAQFAGPYTLIYDGPDADEWTGLALERDVVQTYLQ
jgi:hypothetical protein